MRVMCNLNRSRSYEISVVLFFFFQKIFNLIGLLAYIFFYEKSRLHITKRGSYVSETRGLKCIIFTVV